MDIIKPFIDDEHSEEFKKYGGFHTGVDVNVFDVKALASGVVIDIGRESGGVAVTVQFDVNSCLRYMHMRLINLHLGSTLKKGDSVGLSNKYLHFEYIKPISIKPIWPVRIGKLTYYKHDPTPIITGDLVIDNTDVWYANLDLNFEYVDDEIEVIIPPPIDDDMVGSRMINQGAKTKVVRGRRVII